MTTDAVLGTLLQSIPLAVAVVGAAYLSYVITDTLAEAEYRLLRRLNCLQAELRHDIWRDIVYEEGRDEDKDRGEALMARARRRLGGRYQ